MLRELSLVVALFAGTAVAAPVASEGDAPPVPVVYISPPYPPLDDGSTPRGSLIVGFKLTPEFRAPVEVRLLESDLPDAFYDAVTVALSYWRFRPAGDPYGCMSQVHRVALTVEFDPAFGSRVVSLISNAQQIPFDAPARYASRADVVAAIERLEGLLKPAEPLDIKYPFFKRGSRATGYVAVRMRVDEQGRVHDPVVVAAHPVDTFEKATLKGLRKAQFVPVIVDGRPTAVSACFIQHFGLAFRQE